MDKTKNNKIDAMEDQSGSAKIDLKFAQINLLHCKRATYTYCRGLKMEHTNISLIQEPWVRGNKIHGFGQLHNRLFYCKTGKKPRTAIHVSQDVNAMILNQFTDDDIVVVRVCREAKDGGDFLVLSVYMPYDQAVPPPGPSLAKVVDYCEAERVPLIVGADSNAHQVIWGSTGVNRRGELLTDYLVTTDLMVLNRGGKPTFVNAIRKECIDVTLASCALTDLIHSWRVVDEETFSDHRLIKFNLSGNFPCREPYRNPRKTNWDEYREVLRNKLSGIACHDRYLTVGSLEQANQDITLAMVEAYHSSCPLVFPKPLYKSSLWSDYLEAKKVKLRKAWNRAGKRVADQGKRKDEYRVLLRDYKDSQEKIKDRCKAKFFEEADSVPAFARIHKVLAKDPAAQVGSLLRPDGSYTVNSRDTAEHLLETHFPGSTQSAQEVPVLNSAAHSRRDWKFAERLTKRGRIRFAVHKFHSFKSAGLDGVFPALLKQGLELLLSRLASVFKSSFVLGYIPKGWEKVRVAFIPKPGKATHCTAKDFRPISLTSFLLKTAERLLDFYIRREVLREFPLHANQHAYQMGKSTDTALHQMTQKIESRLGNGNFSLGCFMDIEGAFDNTEFDVIAGAARERHVEGLAIRWIVRMLSGRTVEATVCGTKTRLGVTRGCPQGGILSPILWCMVIDSLLVRLNESGVFTQGYSDDVSSLVRGFCLSTVGDIMRSTLKVVEGWCTEKGLKVNPVKTKVILFSKNYKVSEQELGTFKLFGIELTLRANVKYLGVIFDYRMTWIAHLDEKLNKAVGIFWMCRNAFGRTWGLSPRAI